MCTLIVVAFNNQGLGWKIEGTMHDIYGIQTYHNAATIVLIL